MLNNHNYVLPSPSISRLDELLNRNQMIYQNLKEKLDGINKSNQLIYRNIEHLHESFNDQQSSNIERENNRLSSAFSFKPKNVKKIYQAQNSYNTFNSQDPDIDKIQERNEITFSQDTNRHIDQYNLIMEEKNRRQISIERQSNQRQQYIMAKAKQRQEQIQMAELKEREREIERNNRIKEQNRIAQIIRQQYKLKQLERILELEQIAELERISARKIQEAHEIALLEQKLAQERKQSSHILSEYSQDLNKHSTDKNMFRKSNENDLFTPKSNYVYLQNMPNIPEQSHSRQMPTFRHLVNAQSQAIFPIRQQIKLIDQTEKRKTPQKNQKNQIPSKFTQSKFKQELPNNDYDLNNVLARTSKTWKQSGQKSDSIYVDLQLTPKKVVQSLIKPQLNMKSNESLNEADYYIPFCYVFLPFNKLYRSPIIQMSTNNTIVLERKSKTTNITSNKNKIVDGIKFKFKNIITDEQFLLKSLFYDLKQVSPQDLAQDQLHEEKILKCNKIAIVGGRDSLKKKIHMGILAYAYQYLLKKIQKSKNAVICNLQHQQINPFTKNTQFDITIIIEPLDRKIGLMKFQKSIEEIYQIIRKNSAPPTTTCSTNSTSATKKILRMTKISFSIQKNLAYSLNLISSNRYDFEFMGCLKVEKIVWCVNPLVKNYDEVKETLESMKSYIGIRKTY